MALLNIFNYLEAQIQTVIRTPDRTSEINALKTQMNGTIALTDFASRVGMDKLSNNPNIGGTPYTKLEGSIGAFYVNDSAVKTLTRLNYALNGFEYVYEGKTYITSSNTIDSVILDSATYVFRTFKLDGKSLPRVLKVVDHQGRNTIYIYRGSEFKPELKPGPLVDYKPAHYEWTEPVYLFELQDKLVVLNNFKGLIAAFPGKEDDIKHFIKVNRINKSNPFALRVLLGYINQL